MRGFLVLGRASEVAEGPGPYYATVCVMTEEECIAVAGVQERDDKMMYEDDDGVTRSYTGFIAMCNAIEPSE